MDIRHILVVIDASREEQQPALERATQLLEHYRQASMNKAAETVYKHLLEVGNQEAYPATLFGLVLIIAGLVIQQIKFSKNKPA